MNNETVNQKLRDAYQEATPDVLEHVLSSCEQGKGTYMEMNKVKRTWNKGFAGILLACTIAIVAIVPGVLTKEPLPVVASTVVLDVNPSIEIQVDDQEKIIDIVALNEDALEILGDLDYTGSDIEVAMNSLVASMIQEGYLSDLKNSILVSVEGKSSKEEDVLQEKIRATIDAILQESDLEVAISSQGYELDDDIQSLMETYHISAGKAAMIEQLVSSNELYKASDLASLSVHELTLLSTSSRNDVPGLTTVGNPSTSGYIGTSKALSIALNHAGVKESAVTSKDIELDYDDQVMVYDVEFTTASMEYDYEINAVSGAIVKVEKEANDDAVNYTENNTTNNTTNQSSLISSSKAWDIALKHAGVSGTTYAKEIELEKEDGVNYYDISFKTTTMEYDYLIHATSGKVVEVEREQIEKDDDKDDDKDDEKTPVSIPEDKSMLSTSKVWSIVVNHAGVSGNLYEKEIELDHDDGKDVYEVSFKSDTHEYEYEVDAKTGGIYTCEKEARDND